MDILIYQQDQVAFVLFTAFVFGVITTFRPAFGFYATVFFLPLYIFRIRGTAIPTNILELILVLSVLGWIGYCLGHHKKIYLPDKFMLLGLVLLVAGAFVSLAATKNEFFLQSAGIFKGFIIEPIIFSLALYSAIKQNLVHKENIVRILALSAGAVACISLGGVIISYLFHISVISEQSFWTYDGRLNGFYLSPNHLAMYLAPLVPLIIYSVIWNKQKNRILYIGILGIVTAALFLTKSFGAWLGLFVALGLYCVVWLKPSFSKLKSDFNIKVITLAGLMMMCLVALVLRQEIVDFLVNPERSSWASRIQIWQAALAILRDSPLFGIGLGTFQEYYLAYQKHFPLYLEWAVPQPHNVFFAFWLQTGILGLAGFIWLIWRFLRRLKSDFNRPCLAGTDPASWVCPSLDKKTAAIVAAVAIIFIHGLIDTTIWKNDLAAMFFLMLFLH